MRRLLSPPSPPPLRRLIRPRTFTVLALESSADDSCAAIVSDAPRILSNVVLKQHEIHEVYGGIHPKHAIEGHQHNMVRALLSPLSSAHFFSSPSPSDAPSTTPTSTSATASTASRSPAAQASAAVSASHPTPPNPSPLLSTCPSSASTTWQAPLSLFPPVPSPTAPPPQQAHALTPLLTQHPNPPTFPFLTLLVSGGHTLLLLASSPTSFRILATTPDESIGRSFDKVSRHLALPWTALGPGAALEQFCAQPFDDSDLPQIPPYPRPFKGQLAFSYSSLHSYVERYLHAKGGLHNIDLPTRLALARGFQTAAVAQLEEKLLLAFHWCQSQDIHVHHLVVSGGVASNTFLRKRLAACITNVHSPITLSFPPPALCTDNAVMIAWASMHRFLAGDHDPYTIELLPKWNIDTL
ncbi:hypothetical protein C0995_016001 [Termitomyces sp. Mi166|nr:hypothetical protein C0995_016001 [Termitomyces sp. Mi166\